MMPLSGQMELGFAQPLEQIQRATVQNENLSLEAELEQFREFGKPTVEMATEGEGFSPVRTFVNEFWTAKQRACHSLHEVSYRACFKPQLPRFFIERLTEPGEVVYDPFSGRGTTGLEAALLGRVPFACDVNPLARILLEPRLAPPSEQEVAKRLEEIPWDRPGEMPEELLVFYHPETLREISALKRYLNEREANGELDAGDRWIRMVAVNRMTGHSAGFFSVYTLPPNQAVSVKSQRRINERRDQIPPRRLVPKIILRKTNQLLRDFWPREAESLAIASKSARLLVGASAATPAIPDNSVSLVVTSPPFLDVVDYAGDNWLRWWFCGILEDAVKIKLAKKLPAWEEMMTAVFKELSRVLKPGGHVAFEVGEVRNGKVLLERSVIRCGLAAGLAPRLVLINDQKFTKTANCWGVDNSVKGTNTNRVVLFTKNSPVTSA